MDTDQIWIALAAGLPSFLLGFLGYRQSRKVDAVAAQSGMASESRAGIEQVIQGLNGVIDNLQEDNTAFRDEVRYLTGRITEIITQCDEAKRQLNGLRRKYGENGDNGVSTTNK